MTTTHTDDSLTLVRCADCRFAVQHRAVNQATGRYILKVGCSKGHWRKGDCDLHRVMARRTSKCKDYVSMSDSEQDRKKYLETLAATLPIERIIYEANGEPADILEAQGW